MVSHDFCQVTFENQSSMVIILLLKGKLMKSIWSKFVELCKFQWNSFIEFLYSAWAKFWTALKNIIVDFILNVSKAVWELIKAAAQLFVALATAVGGGTFVLIYEAGVWCVNKIIVWVKKI